MGHARMSAALTDQHRTINWLEQARVDISDGELSPLRNYHNPTDYHSQASLA
ncbi:MAG: hypothetical protein QOF52_2107 [Propionibacteriaceae bacterium]|jgi:hypothetical protein|nr:hypothetical protein [Propionibacteriaceae bacterium]MDX6322249.1 hypothetical protein [Propionibacteriaceae bacterium]